MSNDIAGKPRKLGRGLSSLIGMPVVVRSGGEVGARVGGPVENDGPAAVAPAAVESGARDGDGRRLVWIKVDDVVASPFQPRRVFEEGALAGLAESIKVAGVMQPVLVRRRGVAERMAEGGGGMEGANYELVAGERRWRGAKLAGLTEIPAVVAELSDEEAASWGIVENVQREDLGVMEKAAAFDNLAKRFSMTQVQIAERVGVDRASVSHLVRLLELEGPVREQIERGELTSGHGKALLMLSPGPGRVAMAKRSAEQRWTVRQLEVACAAAVHGVSAGGGALGMVSSDQDGLSAEAAQAAELELRSRALHRTDLEQRVAKALGTKVRLTTDKKGVKGKLVIAFYSVDQFEGLMVKMGVMKSGY